MRILLSPAVKRYLKRLKKKDAILLERIEKQLILFAANPRHPSLRTHKLTGKTENVWSISAGLKLRLLYLVKDEGFYFFDIGSHDDVYAN